MIIIKIILIFILITAVFLVNNNYKQQKDRIIKENDKYNKYIALLSSVYSKDNQQKIDPKVIKQELNNLLNHMEDMNIVIVDELSETSNNQTSIAFRIKKKYFLNFLEYLYDNNRSYYVNSFSLISTDDEYIKLSMVIEYLYFLPASGWDSYFIDPRGLRLKFWKEELKKQEEKRRLEEQKRIIENQKKESSLYLTNRDRRKEETTESLQISEFSLQIKYKGNLVISNKKFGIIEYNNNEVFYEEGKTYTLEGFAIKVLEVTDSHILIEVNGKIYTYKAEIL